MPVLERDPWRFQFFKDVPCPDDVVIPTDDPDCWNLYPRHRWIYEKLQIAASQGLMSGPHGVAPEFYPVFSKPMMNLKGMGLGSRIMPDADAMAHGYQPGHMWMELLTGDHVSTDCAVLDGKIVWSRHATGVPWDGGTFKYWKIHAARLPELDTYLALWVERHMPGYAGMMNFETIGGRIIEAHLRFADQWCDLYGDGWIEALIELYAGGGWNHDDSNRRDGYSVPLFGSHGSRVRHPPASLQHHVRNMPHVKSLQITFFEDKPLEDHPMPPGGFRLGIVNATDLNAGLAARRMLATAFPDDIIQHQD